MEYPKTYTIVRQGRSQVVSVSNLDELIALRTELELIRRFGAGASEQIIDALDRRIAQLAPRGSSEQSGRGDCVGELEEMRTILCDSLAPANREATEQIDRDCPQAKVGVAMQSIEKDTKEFRDDVVDQLASSEVDDVDALLAAFEQADKETAADEGDQASAGGEAMEEDLEALLASVSVETDAAQADSIDADLAQLTASVNALQASEPVAAELPTVDEAFAVEDAAPVGPAVDEVTEPSDQLEAGDSGQPVESAPANIESVTEQVSETLTNAEVQLDAIASAFEVAAAELGQISSEVAQAAPEVVADRQIDAASPVAEPEPPAVVDVCVPQVVEPAPAATAPAPVAAPRIAVSAPQTHSEPVTCPSGPKMANQLRGQLQQARANILSELDDLLVMIDRVDQMQSQADQAVRKAREFEQAAARARQANQLLASAESEAAKARAAFEQAQSKVNGARETWEAAQHEAALAAAGTSDCQL